MIRLSYSKFAGSSTSIEMLVLGSLTEIKVHRGWILKSQLHGDLRQEISSELTFETLKHTATHCNTLQHTATQRNTLQHTTTQQHTCYQGDVSYESAHTATNTTTHTATRTATHCNTLQHTATYCNARGTKETCHMNQFVWYICTVGLFSHGIRLFSWVTGLFGRHIGRIWGAMSVSHKSIRVTPLHCRALFKKQVTKKRS